MSRASRLGRIKASLLAHYRPFPCKFDNTWLRDVFQNCFNEVKLLGNSIHSSSSRVLTKVTKQFSKFFIKEISLRIYMWLHSFRKSWFWCEIGQIDVCANPTLPKEPSGWVNRECFIPKRCRRLLPSQPKFWTTVLSMSCHAVLDCIN